MLTLLTLLYLLTLLTCFTYLLYFTYLPERIFGEFYQVGALNKDLESRGARILGARELGARLGLSAVGYRL